MVTIKKTTQSCLVTWMTTVKKEKTMMVSYLMRTTKMLKAANFRMRTTFLTTVKRERMSSTRARVNKLKFQPTKDPSTERCSLIKDAVT